MSTEKDEEEKEIMREKQRKKRREFLKKGGMVAGMGALSMAGGGAGNVITEKVKSQLQPQQTKEPPDFIEKGSFQTTADYIIFKEGDVIKAKDGSTGAIAFQGTDFATVLQNAIDAIHARANHAGVIYIKPDKKEHYQVTKTITVKNTVKIIGGGAIRTSLELVDGANCNMFEISPDNSSMLVELSGMNLGGNSDNNTGGSAIVDYRGDEFKVKDMHIGNWADYGIKLAPREGIGKVIIHDCIVYANEGSQVLVTEDGGYISSLRVLDSWIMSQSGQIGIDIASGSGAENILMNGNLLEYNDLIRINGGSGINIVGNQFASVASTYGVRFVGQASATDFNTIIANNQFNAGGGNPADYGVEVGDYCQGLVVENNKFDGFATKAVNLGADTQVLVRGNDPTYYDLDEVITGIAGGGTATSSAISRASLGDDIEVRVVPNADPSNDVAFRGRVFWDDSAGALKVKIEETASAGGGDVRVLAKKV